METSIISILMGNQPNHSNKTLQKSNHPKRKRRYHSEMSQSFIIQK